ncbi:6,7-dimethyl-8-ribityllumazine synthase [uncultured Boseongicola sp.]|jgi:6,7-dimethyl-8-ribityllumazine synthase|uniref:6,7-dimethyl-8-ribityllumazine synthase n=1 Tax=uncultured Boseongicola sp. TaxID=1648499 RepID=UPI002633B47A|nr:6,7-dimethyl-8-ribityllumazine synthase [uncultured Boseongicola sp.]
MAGHSDNDMELPTFADPVKVAIVIAPYYTKISDSQLGSARAVLDRAGAAHETIEVPGSLEIPAAVALGHRMSNFDGFVALGCVIRGRTSHYDVVVNESARGLMLLGLQGVAVGNGIITVENMEQAEERADTDRLDTAGGAAAAALHLIALARRFGQPKKKIGFTQDILMAGDSEGPTTA